MVRCDDLSKCANYVLYLLLCGSCSGDHCNRAFLLLPPVIGTRIIKPHEAWSFGCLPFQICKRTRQTYTIALAHVYHHLSPVFFFVCVGVCERECVRVCACMRVYSKRDWGEARLKRRLVVQLASFSEHGTQRHMGVACYRSECTYHYLYP